MNQERFVRRFSLAALVTVAALIATPGSAGAATQVGQTGVPDAFCDDNDNIVQSATAGPPSYAVPAGGGVITSWSFQAAADGSMGKMIVFRPTAAPDQFIVVGKTDPQTFTAAVQTFATRISVQAGDLLGMRMTAPSPDGAQCLLSTPSVGDQIRFNIDTPEPPDGSTQTLNNNLSNLRILVAAAVEADADNDGFGDETQDQCPTDASTQGTCPVPGPSPAPATTPPTCKGTPATIVGTEGDDVRTGTPGPDVMLGLGGNDNFSGLGGNDVICGAKGNDTLKGGPGTTFSAAKRAMTRSSARKAMTSSAV